jgi:hypothetical protein
LYRAAAAHLRGHVVNEAPERTAKVMFDGDIVTDIVVRAASNPARLGDGAWAGPLARQAVEDSVQAITSLSAAADLIGRGLKLEFDGAGTIRVPGRLVDASDAGAWVAEGLPQPVRALRITGGPILAPRKLAVITPYTREMAESSNLEAIARALISEATALALDAALFSTAADDGAHPAGILNGVTPLTPTTGGGAAALAGDVKNLITALVAAGAGRAPILITNATQAASLSLLAGAKFDMDVLASTQIAPGTIIAIEPSSFVSAMSAVPAFEVSDQTTIHMDTAPTDVVAGVPTRSLFQTDSIALKMNLTASWTMRAPHVAVVNSVTW